MFDFPELLSPGEGALLLAEPSTLKVHCNCFGRKGYSNYE